MMGHTHLLIGGSAWLGAYALATAGNITHPTATVAFCGWVVASYAALLPDIDTRHSMASQMFGWASEAVSWVIRNATGGHRKFTHSLLALVLVGTVAFVCVGSFRLQPWAAAAIVLGYASHIATDMITKEGCPLFWPIHSDKFGLHLITTNKKTERWFITPAATMASMVAACALWYLG